MDEDYWVKSFSEEKTAVLDKNALIDFFLHSYQEGEGSISGS